MTSQVFTLPLKDRGKPLELLADAYDQSGINGTAQRMRRGVVTEQDLIAIIAIEAALATPTTFA